MDLDGIKSVAARDVSRRRLLQGLGAAAGAGALGGWGPATSDPVYAATTGYELENTAPVDTYQPPRGLAKKSPPKDTALAWINQNADTVTGLSDQIWAFAELSLREWRSSYATAQLLQRHGFTIAWGTAGLPAAFTATFRQGRGGPVLGFNGESDALPGLSQRKGVAKHDPLVYNYDAYGPTYGSGHGDAHNALGAASAGAAIATATALRRHNLSATLTFFGSSGEEQLIGKAYAVRAGAYNGLDVFLDWHPGPVTDASWAPLGTLNSTTFTFLGAAGHGGSPLGNKSGLDGALLMAHMTEYLRQNNVAPSARLHYAITNGGGGPNVAPDLCSIWYYVREGSPARMQVLYDKVVACAKAAASASQTKLSYRLNSAIWNTLGNKAGAELVYDNMLAIGAPKVASADVEFAKALQRELGRPDVGLPQSIVPLKPPNPTFLGGPSSDVGEVSWITPRVGFFCATWPPGIPFHNWATTACSASNITHAGLLAAARYLAATAVDLVLQPNLLASIREEFKTRTAKVQWKSLLPPELQPPIYEPPAWFLDETGQRWPTPGITWPVEKIIARERLGTTGPELPPVA
jgi:amidohydrolase